ncbi:MAG: hypothetical protein K9H16_07815 [Bacteroidales bacterium]|nr:hypothetical protein [Bacteroidales bacterium]
MAYIYLFVKIYKDYREAITKNIFLSVFFFTMPLSAFINGMYYYFPVLVLYLFFVMLKIETEGSLIPDKT